MSDSCLETPGQPRLTRGHTDTNLPRQLNVSILARSGRRPLSRAMTEARTDKRAAAAPVTDPTLRPIRTSLSWLARIYMSACILTAFIDSWPQAGHIGIILPNSVRFIIMKRQGSEFRLPLRWSVILTISSASGLLVGTETGLILGILTFFLVLSVVERIL